METSYFVGTPFKREGKSKMESEKRKGGEVSYTIAGVVEATGMCSTLVRTAIRQGKLRARYVGRKPLIMRSDLEEFLSDLPQVAPHRRESAAA